MTATNRVPKPGDRVRVLRCDDGALRAGEVYVAATDQQGEGQALLRHPDVALLDALGDRWEVVDGG